MTRALTLLTSVPATIALAVGLGAGTASAQTVTAPADPSTHGVVHYDGIDIPAHIRHQVNSALGSVGITVPWPLLDFIDDDWDDFDDDWDDDWDD